MPISGAATAPTKKGKAPSNAAAVPAFCLWLSSTIADAAGAAMPNDVIIKNSIVSSKATGTLSVAQRAAATANHKIEKPENTTAYLRRLNFAENAAPMPMPTAFSANTELNSIGLKS